MLWCSAMIKDDVDLYYVCMYYMYDVCMYVDVLYVWFILCRWYEIYTSPEYILYILVMGFLL